MDELTRLVAKDAIRDVIARYSRAIDRLDAELLLSVYHQDAVDEVPVPPRNLAPGERGRPETAVRRSLPADFVAWVIPLMRANYLSTSHVLNNQLIDFADDDHAEVETYYGCVQIVWKIAHRFNVIDSYNAVPLTPWDGHADPEQPYIGRRDRRDYSYRDRAAPGRGT